MLAKIARVLLIFHTILEIESASDSLLSKSVHDNHTSNNQSVDKKCLTTRGNNPQGHFACKYKHPSLSRFPAHVNPRFIDLGHGNTAGNEKVEAPEGKLSILDLFPDNEEEEEKEDEEEEEKENAQVKPEEEEAEENEEHYDFGFFGEEDVDINKPNGTKSESFLKQYHRQSLRMHRLVFPLLLAYKLKFFTVIPLLLGSLVLLVGTTGVAGFFFALFAAALGIRAKSEH